MTTNAINSIGVVGNPKIAFKKEVEENVEKKEIQSEDKSSMIVAGLAAAAALGVAGFMIAKGRGGRAGEQGQEAVEQLVRSGEEIVQENPRLVNSDMLGSSILNTPNLPNRPVRVATGRIVEQNEDLIEITPRFEIVEQA